MAGLRLRASCAGALCDLVFEEFPTWVLHRSIHGGSVRARGVMPRFHLIRHGKVFRTGQRAFFFTPAHLIPPRVSVSVPHNPGPRTGVAHAPALRDIDLSTPTAPCQARRQVDVAKKKRGSQEVPKR